MWIVIIHKREVSNVAGEKVLTGEQEKKSLAEKLWLAYFNQYLYEHNLITEAQRNRMALKIDSRKATTFGTKQRCGWE